MSPSCLQIKYFKELIKLGLIGVQKCALFGNFHSKSAIICEEKCHNLAFLEKFKAQNEYYYNRVYQKSPIFSIKDENWISLVWISEGVVPTVLVFAMITLLT